MRRLLLSLAVLCVAALALAHPPGGGAKGPSKADPLLKQAAEAKRRGDTAGYAAAMAEAKKILASEERFACCIKGGCDECAKERDCGCGADLFAGKGVCQECVDGIHAGNGRYEVADPALVKLAPMGTMPGLLGPWSMNREGSGTSWIPASSPMYGRMRTFGAWQGMEMATVFGAFTDAGGKRGEAQLYAASQYMLMARKGDAKDRVIALRGMVSLDALTNGRRGYPNLFQTGEGLTDRQHPHDLFMELAASYSAPLGRSTRGFLYAAPVGEPALGPAAYLHRPSGWDYPAAPISHHWLDASHITFGVATAGLTLGDRWKLEGSVFTGREPDARRYDFDRMRLDSHAGRITFSPGSDIAVQASYGFLKSPEASEAEHDAHRFTASVQHNKALPNGANLSSLIAFGRNIGAHGNTNARLVELSYLRGRGSLFFRYDDTDENELENAPEGVWRVRKVTLGATHGQVGAAVDLFAVPSGLTSTYGRAPVSVTAFWRWRFGKM